MFGKTGFGSKFQPNTSGFDWQRFESKTACDQDPAGPVQREARAPGRVHLRRAHQPPIPGYSMLLILDNNSDHDVHA